MIDNILNKDFNELTYKERMLVIEYFRKIVNDEFKEFKDNLLKEDKEFIFERAYLIDTYDNIRIRLCSLSFLTITYLLKYQKIILLIICIMLMLMIVFLNTTTT